MPNNWKTYKLGEITNVITKGTTPSTYGFGFIDKGVNFIKSESTNYDGRLDETVFVKVSAEAHNKLKRSQLEEDDILFSMAGAYLGKTGMVYKNHLPANTNQANGIIRVNKNKALPKFVSFLLRNPSLISYVNASAGQSAQPNINLADIGSLEFKLPPFQEQQSIVSILSAIDDKIENNLAINKTLEEMAMALYKHWFVDFSPFQEGEFVESELGMIPKGWEVKKIGDFIKHKKGFAFKSNWYQQIGEIVVRVSDTTHNSIDIKSCERISSELASNYQNYSLKTNDVVIATVGSWPPNYASVVGKVIRVPITANGALLNQNAVILNMSINDKTEQGLLYCTLKNERFLKYIVNSAQGSANQASIKLTDIYNYLIPIGENIKIEEFSTQIELYISQQNSLIEENQSLIQLRDTLLPQLISGNVRLKEFRETVEEVL